MMLDAKTLAGFLCNTPGISIDRLDSESIAETLLDHMVEAGILVRAAGEDLATLRAIGDAGEGALYLDRETIRNLRELHE